MCYITLWALKHFMEKNLLENYFIFSESILWQPVIHSRTHFFYFTFPSSFQHKLYFTFPSSFQYNFTLHSQVHFSINSINFTLHFQVHFSINFTKIRNCNRHVQGSYCIIVMHWWIVHFKLLFSLEGTEQIHTEGKSYAPSILISVLWYQFL